MSVLEKVPVATRMCVEVERVICQRCRRGSAIAHHEIEELGFGILQVQIATDLPSVRGRFWAGAGGASSEEGGPDAPGGGSGAPEDDECAAHEIIVKQ